jgi:hypothetical protein
MRSRTLFAAAIALCVTCVSLARADPCHDDNNIGTNDGACWRSLQPIEKFSIIQGIWIGKQVRTEALQMSAQTGSIWFGMDWSSTPPETTVGDIAEYFDRLYETPVNRKIQWDKAYLLAALYARDDDENDRLALLTFLRSNEALPTEGEIVGVRSPNVLAIKSGDKTFDVRLDGVVVPQNIAAKAEAFLKGLALAGFGSCEAPQPTPVSLYYRRELFDDQSRLTADVRIQSYMQICVSGKPVHLTEGNFTNVGYYLISHGLAEQDTRTDPKWSDNRNRKSSIDPAEKAKEAKMYLYGDTTDPIIEMISGRLPADTY